MTACMLVTIVLKYTAAAGDPAGHGTEPFHELLVSLSLVTNIYDYGPTGPDTTETLSCSVTVTNVKF